VHGLNPAHGLGLSGMVACHVRPAEKLAGPRPGGPVQPRRRPAARERARVRRACSVVTVRSPHAGWRGGTLTGGPVAASRWQGTAGKYQHGSGVTLDGTTEGEAHPSSGSTCGGGAEAARRCPTVAEALQ
jgi:hypothetical protein